MLRFEWDEQKNKRNRAKHKVWFEEAQSVFDEPRGRGSTTTTTPSRKSAS
jgi:uncharacterized DUF497 family protein